MNKSKWLNIGALIALIFTLYVNYLANALPLNGYYTYQLSDMYPNLFVPAGITFSIWGVIYLGLLSFVFYRMFFIKPNERNAISDEISIYFILSCVANAGWLFSFHYLHIGISAAMMMVLLYSLVVIWQLIQKNNRSKWERYPISIYFGWICVATIASFTTVIVDNEWINSASTEVLLTLLMMTIAAGLAIYFVQKFKDVVFSLVFVWAFTGIFIKQQHAQPTISGYAMLLIVIIFLLAIMSVFKKKKKVRKK